MSAPEGKKNLNDDLQGRRFSQRQKKPNKKYVSDTQSDFHAQDPRVPRSQRSVCDIEQEKKKDREKMADNVKEFLAKAREDDRANRAKNMTSTPHERVTKETQVDRSQEELEDDIALGESAISEVGKRDHYENGEEHEQEEDKADLTSSDEEDSEHQIIRIKSKLKATHKGFVYHKDSSNRNTDYFKCANSNTGCKGRAKLKESIFTVTQGHSCEQPKIFQNVSEAVDFMVRAQQHLKESIRDLFDQLGSIKDEGHKKAVTEILEETRKCRKLLVTASRMSWPKERHDTVFTACEMKFCLMRIIHYVDRGFKDNQLMWGKVRKWENLFQQNLTQGIIHEEFAPFNQGRLDFDAVDQVSVSSSKPQSLSVTSRVPSGNKSQAAHRPKPMADINEQEHEDHNNVQQGDDDGNAGQAGLSFRTAPLPEETPAKDPANNVDLGGQSSGVDHPNPGHKNTGQDTNEDQGLQRLLEAKRLYDEHVQRKSAELSAKLKEINRVSKQLEDNRHAMRQEFREEKANIKKAHDQEQREWRRHQDEEKAKLQREDERLQRERQAAEREKHEIADYRRHQRQELQAERERLREREAQLLHQHQVRQDNWSVSLPDIPSGQGRRGPVPRFNMAQERRDQAPRFNIDPDLLAGYNNQDYKERSSSYYDQALADHLAEERARQEEERLRNERTGNRFDRDQSPGSGHQSRNGRNQAGTTPDNDVWQGRYPPQQDPRVSNQDGRRNNANQGYNRGQPYQPQRATIPLNPPEQWYTQLPPPWNQVPTPESKADDLTKTITAGSFTKFDGAVLHYLPWRSRFIAAAHCKNISEQAKNQYLTTALDRDADPMLTTIINSTLCSTDGYREAIKLLEEAYGGPDQNMRRFEAELDNMPMLIPTNLSSLNNWMAKILSIKATYQAANPNHQNDPLILRLVSMKAPVQFNVDWDLWLKGQTLPKSMQNLIAYLRLRQAALRSSTPTPSPSKTSMPPKRRAGAHVSLNTIEEENINYQDVQSSQNMELNEQDDRAEDLEEAHVHLGGQFNNDKPKCELGCEQPHLLKSCKKFLDMTATERRSFVKKHDRCMACLNKGHTNNPCPKKFKCLLCRGPHHTLLHEDRPRSNDSNPKSGGRNDRRDPPGSNSGGAGPEGLQANRTLGSSTNNSGQGSSRSNMSEEATTMNTVTHNPTVDEAFCLKNGIAPCLKSLRCLPVKISNIKTGKSILTNALLDDGNTTTMISEDVQRAIQAQGPRHDFQVHGTGGIATPYKSMRTEIKIQSLSSDFERNIKVRVIPSPAGDYQPVDWTEYQKLWEHIADLPVQAPLQDRGIGIMLGNDYTDLMASIKEIIGKQGQPCARLTKLGWTITGPVSEESSAAMSIAKYSLANNTPVEYKEYYDQEVHTSMKVATKVSNQEFDQRYRSFYEEELNDMVRKYVVADMLDCEQDQGDEKISNEERYILNKVKATHKRLEDGRHQIGCTWKRGEPKLVNNRKQALVRLESLERHPFMQSPANKKMYEDILQQHLDDGFVEKVPEEDLGRRDAFYLAHFPVLRPDKCTTKIRIVFDGKQKFYNKSLNDAVHKGPNLSNCLFSVLLRFRKYAVAVTGDIKQMFLQVSMAPEDRHYHRFLYRSDPKQEPTEYQWCRHPFGNSGSPFVCQFVMRQQAEQFRSKYPNVVNAIYISTVVDDTLLSFKTPQEAEQFIKALIEIYADGQWDVKKFASNNQEVMKSLPEDKRAPNMVMNAETVEGGESKPTGALGLKWSPEGDVFTFRFAPAKQVRGKWSKRALLTTQASVFDPLGQLSPFIMKARLILQDLWRIKLDWDDPIPEESEMKWLAWAQQLEHLPDIKFLRCLQPTGKIKQEELHTFADASATGYGAATYLLTKYGSGEVIVNLAMSKSRVMPIKADTIPRLELKAAVLGVDLWKVVSKALEVPKEKSFFWSDSGAVLAWIKTPSKALKMFVANRTRHIQEETLIDHWRWVPSELNPADMISRGADLSEFAELPFWLHGPEFLQQGDVPDQNRIQVRDEALHEIKKEVLTNNPELSDHPSMIVSLSAVNLDPRDQFAGKHLNRPVPSAAGLNECLPDPERFSSWRKLRRVTARILRLCVGHNRLSGAEALDWAEDLLVRRDQERVYSEEIKTLKNGHILLKRHALAKLRPFVDQQGMLRAHSRLIHSDITPEEVKFPVILPKTHVSKLLIKYWHEKSLHLGYINQTLKELRCKYHVTGGRKAVRTVLNNCTICRRIKPHVRNPPEGALPDIRLPEPGKVQVFLKTAMDVAGPMLVKSGRKGRPGKRYVLVLTCTVTRAIVLEALESLDLPTFVMAIERFLAEHPKPEKVLSDNYSTFKSADKLFKEFAKVLRQGELEVEFPDIEWTFTPSHTPRYNSVTERLIAIVKKGLKSVFGPKVPNDLEFRTALKKIQGVMNNRPLAYVSTSSDELLPLTPNHFVMGRISAMISPISRKDTAKLGDRYEATQKALEKFSERFHKEIVPTYHEFQKAQGQEYVNLKKDDVVSAIDPNPARKGIWHIGRVMEVEESQDGVVRKVIVYFPGKNGKKGTCLKRQVDKLALLTPHHAHDEHDQ